MLAFRAREWVRGYGASRLAHGKDRIVLIPKTSSVDDLLEVSSKLDAFNKLLRPQIDTWWRPRCSAAVVAI